MPKSLLHIIISANLLFLGISCNEAVQNQSSYRGVWTLDVRHLPSGEKSLPPKISGFMEWYPLDIAKAYVTIAFSNGKEKIQLTESTYTLDEQSFIQTENNRLGGDYSLPYQPIAETPYQTTEGKISADGDQIILNHENSSTYIFEADTLKVIHHSGTIDFWRRTKDEKGLLTK